MLFSDDHRPESGNFPSEALPGHRDSGTRTAPFHPMDDTKEHPLSGENALFVYYDPLNSLIELQYKGWSGINSGS